MIQVFSLSYLQLKKQYPKVFAIKKERSGWYSGLIDKGDAS